MQTRRYVATRPAGITKVLRVQRWLAPSMLLLAVSAGCGDSEQQPAAGSGGAAPGAGGVTGGVSSGSGGASTGGAAGTGGASSGGALTGGVSPTGGANPTGGTNPTGGVSPTGGTNPTGGVSPTGGANPTGGVSPTGGANPTGGTNPTGGVSPTGGASPTGGTNPTGGTSPTGGADPTGGAAPTGGTEPPGGAETGGQATGGSPGVEGPCDIFETDGAPCVGAYSTVRILSSTYDGPLYQVRRGGPDPNTGSGGEVQDIPAIDGFADAATLEAFCGTSVCTVSKLYDQSGVGNHLTVAKAGCYEGTASQDDYESDAKRESVTVGGHKVYSLYMDKHEGYRNNEAQGTATGDDEQTIYMVAAGSGLRRGAGCCCCWNFGTASRNNCYGPTGMMGALYLGTGYWGSGAGDGPWFMGDFEAGVWAGGTGASDWENPNNPSMTMDFAFGMLKVGGQSYALKMGNAQQGDLTTAWDGAKGNWTWQLEGGIILGIGGDNSNSSDGTFFEGAITAGWSSNEADLAVLRNVQAAGYQR